MDVHKEHPVGVSQTVPDDTMSIREIVDRFVTTRRVDERLQRQGFIGDADFDDEDLEEVERMDFVDRSELAQRMRDNVDESQSKIDEYERKRKEAVKLKKEQKAQGSGSSGSDPAYKGSAAEGGTTDAKRPQQPGAKANDVEPEPGLS